jgi:hypothetical protein
MGQLIFVHKKSVIETSTLLFWYLALFLLTSSLILQTITQSDSGVAKEGTHCCGVT